MACSIIENYLVSSACTGASPDPSAVSYGSGTIQLTQKSFCKNGSCLDVPVCQVVTSAGEKNYYLPVDGSLNESKELVLNLFLFSEEVLSGVFLTVALRKSPDLNLLKG